MTTIASRTINTTGLREIADFLAANHRLGGEDFTCDMLNAWAADAEFQMSEGNSPSIELKASDSIHGYTQEYTVCTDANLERLVVDDGGTARAATLDITTRCVQVGKGSNIITRSLKTKIIS